MKEALIGLVGVLVGLVVSEYFRRRARPESYSSVVFNKRLAAYEALHNKINELHDGAAMLIKEDTRSATERHADWNAKTKELFDFLVNNSLYLSPDVIAHAGATVANVDAILAATDASTQNMHTKTYVRNLKLLQEMIRSDSGAQASESLLRRIFRVRHRSEYLDIWKTRYRDNGK